MGLGRLIYDSAKNRVPMEYSEYSVAEREDAIRAKLFEVLEFDETKVMLGFNSKEEAKEAYLSNYDENWKGFMAITSVPLKTFKKWLYRGRKQRQPFRDYVEIKKKQLKENREKQD